MEVRDGFSQWFFQVNQHILEVTEGFTTAECALWVHFLFGNSVRNEHTHTPVAVVSILVVGLTVYSLYETQTLTLNICLTFLHQLMADMVSYKLNIMLQQVYVSEYGVVNTL